MGGIERGAGRIDKEIDLAETLFNHHELGVADIAETVGVIGVSTLGLAWAFCAVAAKAGRYPIGIFLCRCGAPRIGANPRPLSLLNKADSVAAAQSARLTISRR